MRASFRGSGGGWREGEGGKRGERRGTEGRGEGAGREGIEGEGRGSVCVCVRVCMCMCAWGDRGDSHYKNQTAELSSATQQTKAMIFLKLHLHQAFKPVQDPD